MNKSESRRKQREKLFKKGLCVYCGKNSHAENKKGCQICLDNKVSINNKCSKNNPEKSRQYSLLIKHEVIEKYGGKCACCQESNILFLTIDHKNNDGNLERLSGKCSSSSKSFYLKLRKEPVRNDLQVLCYNCNMGKQQNYGVCPHKEIKRKLSESYDNRHNPQFDTRLKIIWPTDDELIKMCNDTCIEEVARQLKLHGTAIRGRLKRRNKYHLVEKKQGGILKGERNAAAKLNAQIVQQIRESSLSRKELAKNYGVSKSTIDKIITRQIWCQNP